MKRFSLILLCGLLFIAVGCKKIEEPIVELQTTEGVLKLKLYKETPLHRDNFVKLVNQGFYDGQLFHKVMKDFIVQAGDSNSRTADKNRLLGEKKSEYTIHAEINYPRYFHKKGVLTALSNPAAETLSDEPSDAYLFSIVTGRKYTANELDTIEHDVYNQRLDIIFQKLVIKYRGKIDHLALRANDKPKLQALQDSLVVLAQQQIQKEKLTFFTKEQRKQYTTIGGVPSLDKNYTIFGEVIQGFDVLDKIANAKVDKIGRPLKDVRIIKAQVVSK